MKIAIPVDENKMDAAVCVSFGRAPYFLLYNTETKETVFLSNSAAAAVGGAGTKSAQLLADNQVDSLLTVRCGQNAAVVFETAQIKIYKTISATAGVNITAFEEGKLALMTQFHPGFQGLQ